MVSGPVDDDLESRPGRARCRRIAVVAVAVAALLSVDSAWTGAAPAVATTPAAVTTAGLSATVPPGLCDPDEVGQTKIGPDGKRYVCEPTGTQGPADGPDHPAEQPDQERLEELASDPSHGGEIRDGNWQEAQAALGLERSGQLPSPVRRDPSGAADFIDGKGVQWDAKAFNSNFPPRKGGYTLEASMRKIGESFRDGENVIAITEDLSSADADELVTAIEEQGWSERVLFWP